MFLGIDVGTSGVKAVVIDAAGTVLDQASAPLTVSRPCPLWSEQAPDDWTRACDLAVRQLSPDLRRRVAGLGLAGQMHGAVLLDRADKPLRPAILWNDGRSFAECAELEDAVPASRQITGNIAMPGFTAPKLLWVRRHEPRIFEQIRTILLPKDYLRLVLTGEKASDLSDSAGTLWLDTGARRWSDEMLAATGLAADQMPTLYEGNETSGHLSKAVAAAWGMEPVPVVAGASDNASGAIGAGVTGDGEALLSLGTSGVIFVATREFRPNPERAVHAFCHCLPGMWHQMSVHLSAASCLDWGAQQLGLDGAGALIDAARQTGPGGGPELFLPYLAGERTPHNDAHVRGALLALDHDTSPARIAAAILEGVAFAHADGLDALREAGTRIDALRVIGGGARSRHWGNILAAVLGVPLLYADGAEVGPALGAARLAANGIGGVDAREAFAAPPAAERVEPDPAIAGRLLPKLERFRRAYPALKSL